MEQQRLTPKYRKLIVLLTVGLIFVLSVGATLAALVQQRSVSGNIAFGKALTVDVANFEVNNYDILQNREIVTQLVPGSVITGVNLKASVKQENVAVGEDVAYIRAQFQVKLENTYENGELIDATDMVYLEKAPTGTNQGAYYWKQVTFTTSTGTISTWWLLMDGESDLPYKVQNEGIVDFIVDGKIVLSSEIPNSFGSQDIEMTFVVEAMQCKNIDPARILTGNDGQPWWDEANNA